MKIALGTKSQLKIRAAQSALVKLGIKAEILSAETDSGVGVQPFGLDEIITGATNRAESSLKTNEATIGVGIENGIIKIDPVGRWLEIPVVVAVNEAGNKSIAFGAAYPLPDWIVEKLQKENKELGFEIQNLDPEAEKDPIKYFSNGFVKREETLSQAIACALLEFINPDKYQTTKQYSMR